MTEKFFELLKKMKIYVNHGISGDEIVKCIDDFVSDDFVYRLSSELSEKVLTLQDEVAFYVSDPIMRNEYSSYFGDERLMQLVKYFVNTTADTEL